MLCASWYWLLISEENGVSVPHLWEREDRSFRPTEAGDFHNASTLNDFLWVVCQFSLFSPMWGVSRAGAWSMGRASHFLLHISLPLYTCPATTHQPLVTNKKAAQRTVTNEKPWHFPRLGSGDKGQICHLSSQISASSLQMILGNVSIEKYRQKKQPPGVSFKFLAFISTENVSIYC